MRKSARHKRSSLKVMSVRAFANAHDMMCGHGAAAGDLCVF